MVEIDTARLTMLRIRNGCLIALLCSVILGCSSTSDPELAHNPIIWADVPDPSVIRFGDNYYMSSTTMHMNPGVPIMKSNDLVHWEMVSYVYDILSDNDALQLVNEDAYGRGSWASSLKYHNNRFYLVTFSYTTNKTYIFQTDDIASSGWEMFTLDALYHDPSLYFEDDRVFLVYGTRDIRIIELTPDVEAVKTDGIHHVLIPAAEDIAGTDFYVPAEGAHLQKIGDYYYVSLITWPKDKMRTQLVYRSDKLLGEYTGKIALQYEGIAQGGFIDTPSGDWYAFLFQDNGAVGRTPYLVPVQWVDNWPILGTEGSVSTILNISANKQDISGIVNSDEFNVPTSEAISNGPAILNGLSLVWQWNHNPQAAYWSLTDRPGHLRLINDRIDSDVLHTRNTLTQRTFGPESSATVLMDVSGLKNGDYAGLGALQQNYGFVGVRKSLDQNYVVMALGNADSFVESESISIQQDSIYLRISFDFKERRDEARFFYSLDGESWHAIGNILHMTYTLPHFMGYRMAIFNFATEQPGGYVDFDFFRITQTAFND